MTEKITKATVESAKVDYAVARAQIYVKNWSLYIRALDTYLERQGVAP